MASGTRVRLDELSGTALRLCQRRHAIEKAGAVKNMLPDATRDDTRNFTLHGPFERTVTLYIISHGNQRDCLEPQ
jgi:hypothetical protein